MKVLLVGAGGREHALAWRIAQSPQLTRLWVAGGNYGTAALADNLPVSPDEVAAVTAAAQQVGADLVVAGPELPLARGLADRLAEVGIPTFGPTQAAARLESSKSFALEVMQQAGVPAPWHRVFDDEAAALRWLQRHPGPVVVKADGLAAGKGVAVCETSAEAMQAVRDCMSGRAFGAAGDTVVLEERLTGREISVFAFCDGERWAPLVAACDYKRRYDGGGGPNTGGMGSFSPPQLWTPPLAAEIGQTIIQPMLQAMAGRGAPYRGVLYAGLMLTAAGPKVLEFNCRLGDPETQAALPLLESDPLELLLACAAGRLDAVAVRWSSRHCAAVSMVSGGYPGEYATGFPISGLEAAGPDCPADAAGRPDCPDSIVFCAGVAADAGGRPVTAGGRVLTAVGLGDSRAAARAAAYRRVAGLSFEGAQWRTDIAADGLGESAGPSVAAAGG